MRGLIRVASNAQFEVSRLAVRFTAMSNRSYIDQMGSVVNAIDDPPFTHANSPKVSRALELYDSARTRILSQAFDTL